MTERAGIPEEASVEEVFVAEARRRLEEAHRILAAGFPRPGTPEISTLHRHAHSLKGIAASLGLDRIDALSREIVLHTEPFERVGVPEVPVDNRALVRRDFLALEAEVEAFAAAHGLQP